MKAVAAQKVHHLVHPVRNQPLLPLLEGPAKKIHSPHEIISTVCDFPYKIIEKCFQ